uniref:Zinc finger CCCH domain-containing protein 3 n=1 Tax=Varanus komodoensis TaxID=61221 RepID=A0A8D2LRR4_VARKO
MEEKEQLKRQIRLLQGLINDHKNVHGDVPVPPPAPTSRWRNPRPPAFNTHGAFSARYAQQTQRDFPACPSSANAWRKKYSLVNVPPRLTLSSGSNVPACTSRILPSHTVAEVAESQPMISGRNVGFRVAAGPAVSHAAGPAVSHTAGPVLAFRGHRTSTAGLAKSGSKESKESCASTLPDVLHCRTSSRNDAPAMCGMGIVAAKGGQGASKVAPDLCRTTSESAVALKSEPQQPLTLPNHESDYLSARKKPASNLPTLYSSQQVASVMDKPNSSRAADASLACANSAWEASSAVETTLLKNENSVPVLQRSPASPASVKSLRFRRTNYTWVANSCKSLRTVKRYATSRAPENARKFSAGVEPVSRLHPRGDLGTKQKKSSLHSKLGISSSQYKWKAFSLQPSPSTSAFTWQRKECGGAPVRRGPLGHGNPKSFSGNTSFLNYKLKSRTKIIKRKGSFCSPSDKRSTAAPAMLLKSRYCLRKRNSPRGRTSPAAKRAGAKGLVQIGKHRLRRLPASRSAKEGKDRLRTVWLVCALNLNFTASLLTCSSPWCCLCRPLVPNRSCHSPPGSKGQPSQYRWKDKGLRCIGGIMYRVSANKLAKTSSAPARSGEAPSRRACGPSASGMTPRDACLFMSPLFSRAVQRSLAIIRQAKQKKEKKKEYCMYYNRFGKCNRGESCPYIHDPDKVAVCTRFLRGTCKKTDGTCPFSHKVSKDKMPVCSYFLKGICNNSDCPYSHVYVSRKAEVCPDFLKGYCPLGEKCKKKHTLVCPDFAKRGICPKGSQCKLHHPQRRNPARQPGPGSSFQHECSTPKRAPPAGQMLWRQGEQRRPFLFPRERVGCGFVTGPREGCSASPLPVHTLHTRVRGWSPRGSGLVPSQAVSLGLTCTTALPITGRSTCAETLLQGTQTGQSLCTGSQRVREKNACPALSLTC